MERSKTESNNSKLKFYQVTEQELVIVDKRRATAGPIIANFIWDLYLPILGYRGIGVLGLLYKLTFKRDKIPLNLHQFAAAGLIGFKQFKTALGLLEKLKFIKIHKPVGLDRGQHKTTIIELFDAPMMVPGEYLDIVKRLSLADDRMDYLADTLIKSEVSNGTSPPKSEVSNGTSMEVSNGTPMEVSNGTSMEVSNGTSIPYKSNLNKSLNNSHTPAAPRAAGPGVGALSVYTFGECRNYADHLKATNQGITNPGGFARKIWRTGEADDLIKEFFATRATAPAILAADCSRCKGNGFYYPEGIGKPVKKCDHVL